jgi:general secretion pathway protein L
MARTLVLRMDPTASEASWQLIENGQLVGPAGQGQLSDARRAAHGNHLVVLVPSEDIFLTKIELPGKNRSRLLKAVPYAIEDQLVDDVEDLHFALSPQPVQGRFLVASVEHKLIEYWRSSLLSAGLRVEAIVPDVFALNKDDGQWRVILESHRALVCTPNSLFATDESNLSFMLSNAVHQAGEGNAPETITVYDCSRSDQMSMLQASTSGINFELIECPDGLFGIFAENYTAKSAVNLLQGEYSRQEKFSRQFRQWIPAAVLFAIWITWQIVAHIFTYIELNNQSESLNQQMVQVYKQAFPGKKVPLYVKRDMKAKIDDMRKKQGRSDVTLNQLLASVAPPLTRAKSINLEGMSYKGGTLEVSVTTRLSTQLDNLKKDIEDQTQWKVDVSGKSTTQGLTKARLLIKGTN